MTSNSDKKQASDAPQDGASTFVLLASMADTTWRMFTPPALFVAGGLWIDLHWGTKPWVTAAATIVGLGCSILLVRAQLRRAQ